MGAIKNIALGIVYGLLDSIKGVSLLLYIDAEIHKINAEEEAEKQRRLKERERRNQRSHSPTPSSAAAMAREELKDLLVREQEERFPNERSLNSILKKQSNEPKPEKKIAKQVVQCCLLNGGFAWLSIIIFEQGITPFVKLCANIILSNNSLAMKTIWTWVQIAISILFFMMWMLPIFLLSKICSSIWFTDIANSAYRVRKGKPQMIPNASKFVADLIFSFIIQIFFLGQSMLMNLLPIPFLGNALYYLHLCLLYTLYSFEYKWINMGWELHRRLSYIENNWPYFLGFGLPLTILTNMTDSIIVSSCIFSIFFPLFLLSSNEAIPIVDTTNVPMRLFTPVIFVSNLLFTRGRPPKIKAAKLAQQKQQLLLQQERQLQEHILIQQRIEEEYLGRSQSRQSERGESTDGSSQQSQQQRPQSARVRQSPSPQAGPFRYQQPPSQPRVSSITRTAPPHVFAEQSHFMSSVPSMASTASASSSAHIAQTVHRR
ncbi:etoposide-induced protein 2.4 homolog isoform X2 [Eurosta solidaginis]|uniref:etoposide-induced protein 2.4 homolog isoform X2 n=1 Tax=Eurosta solidaginis TaxID=178769 RepID=UPI00353079D0